MVIPGNHKFIFLRIPKNASTSLATFFVKGYCNSDTDIYTGINDSKIGMKNINDRITQKYRRHHRFIHLTLNEIINNDIITESQARSRKVIGVIRDPLDRQLSLYFFKRRGKSDISPRGFRSMFSEGCCKDDDNNRILQSDYMKIGDQSVGEWWLYDELDEHLAEFCKEYPPLDNIELPTYKSSFRKSVDKVKQLDEYYDDATRDAVLKYYEKDVELYERLKNDRS